MKCFILISTIVSTVKTTLKDDGVTTAPMISTVTVSNVITATTSMPTRPMLTESSTSVSSGTATSPSHNTTEINSSTKSTNFSPETTSSAKSDITSEPFCSVDWFIKISDKGTECTTTTSTTSTTSTISTTSKISTTSTDFISFATLRPNTTTASTSATTSATEISTSTASTTSTTTTTTPPKCPIPRLFGDNCWDYKAVNKRIYNGNDASVNEYPYHVGLEISCRLVCGGSIISKYWILTAAHCVYDFTTNTTISAANVTIIYNTIDKTKPNRAKVQQIFAHENFTSYCNPKFYGENDIALLQLSEPLDFSLPGVKPICFTKNYDNATHVNATGWGNLRKGKGYPNILQKVTLDVITDQDCQQGLKNSRFGLPPPGTFVCTHTQEKDVTEGDRGGPLVAEKLGCWFQIGVVSYGPNETEGTTIPAVNTRVAYFETWICDITKLCGNSTG